MSKRLLVAFAWLAVLSGTAGQAFAASSATINIDVTVTAALSVSVNDAVSSTDSTSVVWSAGANAMFASPSTSTVLNNSSGITELWSLSTDSYTINTQSMNGSSWAIVGSTLTLPGPDQTAIQAVFGSSNTISCPNTSASDWNQGFAPPLTPIPTLYTSSTFADSNLNAGGAPDPDNGQNQIYAGNKRALCWRLIMPNSTSTTQTQNVQVIITAQSP